MFDTETNRLIANASPLDGLDLDSLPEFLTQAYALVIEARLGATATGRDEAGVEREDWRETLIKLRRLAETYEGLTIFLPPDNPHRAACAFVSGSAHHTLLQAHRVRDGGMEHSNMVPTLSSHRVGPAVSSCLLFLIGSHQADAAEATKSFAWDDSVGPHNEVLTGICALASGDGKALRAFTRMPLREVSQDDLDYLDAATQRLWHHLAVAVQHLSSHVLGDGAADPIPLIDAVVDRIAAAKSTIQVGDNVASIRVPFEGPYHLARLLRATSLVLLTTAVISTQPPEGVEPLPWTAFLRHFAMRRPFLWQNHLEAIGGNFLNVGRSFALTFPTGAGKTTLTELRIAAEVLRGRDVVFLAPTRALVDQVSRDLESSLGIIANDVVRGRFLEDFGERAGAGVYVQTPEQCLAYLSHEVTAHRDVGLIVVDECHQLSGAIVPPAPENTPTRPPGRRSVDAMWTLLTLITRSPGADVILISAMLRNGCEISRWLETVTNRPATVLDLAWKPTRQVRGVVAYDGQTIVDLERTLATAKRNGQRNRKPTATEKRSCAAQPLGLFCHKQVWEEQSSFAKFPLLPGAVTLAVNQFWQLTPNRNEVAGRLLAAMGYGGIPSIVFTQNLSWTTSIAKIGADDLKARGLKPIILTTQEAALFAAAGSELGDDALVERPLGGLVGVHHGLLLLQERLATEAAFARSDGLRALVATPTVAQGINLPAEAVIIAGDDRWEADGGAPETLAVHELLNAAGRAGRAGHFAHGIVIDVPGKVLSVTEDVGTLRLRGLDHVMGLFGSPDQCLDLVDPLTQVIDRIVKEGNETDISRYLVRRLSNLDGATLASVLGSTLGNALRSDRAARVAGQAAVLAAAVDALPKDRTAGAGEWSELAAQTATSVEVVGLLASQVPLPVSVRSWRFAQALSFVMDAILNDVGVLFGLVDPTSSDLARILPRREDPDLEATGDWERRWQAALKEVLPNWLRGVPLIEIGKILRSHRPSTHIKPIVLARRFAIQASAALGHGCSVMCRIIEQSLGSETPPYLASWLALLPGCIREGFDEPDKLLLFWQLRREPGLHPRVIVHSTFNQLRDSIPQWEVHETIEDRRRVLREVFHDTTFRSQL